MGFSQVQAGDSVVFRETAQKIPPALMPGGMGICMGSAEQCDFQDIVASRRGQADQVES